MAKGRRSKLFVGFVAMIGLAVSGCATAPSTQFAYNEEGELVEVEDKSGPNSSTFWIAAIALGVAIAALNSSDSGGGETGRDCYWVVRPGGSTQVCN